ncbi:MAG TPA: tetratricopeptide repeat protein, partial [Anaerolineales bacterium]|nr:tetratricopeptide repeat protein [Anaerolineales bacterium]
ETGRTKKFENVSSNHPDMGGVLWDMSFTEQGKEEVAKLLAEGDRIARVDPKKAAIIFQKAIGFRKHDPHAWYNLGVCQHRLGDRNAAEASYRHVLEFDPSIGQAWNNLGTCLVEQYRLDEGEECFDRGIAIDPDNPKFYLGKGNIAAMHGDFETARRYMNMALKKDPDYQPARDALDKISIMEKMNKGNWLKKILGR